MTVVRQAHPEDLEQLAPLAAEFYALSKFLKRFDLARFVAFWTAMIENESGAVFLVEDEGRRIVGALGAVIYPDIYSGDAIATEFFWICAADSRGRGMELYRAFEAWARFNECIEIRMVHLADSMPERLAVVYKRLGFRVIETAYVKDL